MTSFPFFLKDGLKWALLSEGNLRRPDPDPALKIPNPAKRSESHRNPDLQNCCCNAGDVFDIHIVYDGIRDSDGGEEEIP